MRTLSLARFLAVVRLRRRATLASGTDPLRAILVRTSLHPNTPESKALTKAALAIIRTEGEMAEADLCSLGQDALGLLDEFAERRMSGSYSSEELVAFETRLQAPPTVRSRPVMQRRAVPPF